MIGALFKRNLRQHARLLGLLLGGLVLLELLIVWFGSQIEAGPGLENLLRQFLPPQFQALLAGQIDLLSFAGMIGFGFQHPLVLTAAVAMVMVVATIPGGEHESGFLDLVLARPVPRHRYLLAVIALLVLTALLPPCAVLAGLALGLTIIATPVEVAWTRYLPAALELAMLLLALGACTLLLAARARRRGVAAAQAAAGILVCYWVDALAGLWDPLQPVSRLSPFHYFRPTSAAASGEISAEHGAVLLGLFVVATLLALAVFRRRDL